MDYVKSCIRDIPDFPKPGILFKDITPVLRDPKAFRRVIDVLGERLATVPIDRIVAIESRGFLFGAALADRIERSLVVVRKPGKLPYRTRRVSYALEYGTDTIEVHEDGIDPGDRILIIDDLLATGGTAAAAGRLVEECGGRVASYAFVIELAFLNGRARLGDRGVISLITY
jgi:adenine phosphoribosyltransferase